MKARRQTLRILALSPLVLYSGVALPARQIPPVEQLKAGYRRRLAEKLARNVVPYIDIESSCNPGQLDIDGVASAMDALDIGLMALSADVGGGQFARGIRYDALVRPPGRICVDAAGMNVHVLPVPFSSEFRI